ncbi:MAG: hypothetical protein OXG15_10290 [Gammaproteobacteria bacterium]|nr:hypothetical protein [Gammaproteobacteria bacterium]
MRTIQRATFWLLSVTGLYGLAKSAEQAEQERQLDEIYSHLPESYSDSVDQIEAMLQDMQDENERRAQDVRNEIDRAQSELAELTATVADLGTGTEYHPVELGCSRDVKHDRELAASADYLPPIDVY